jgi:hypothetical protein
VAENHGDIIILPSAIAKMFFTKPWFKMAILGLVWWLKQ